MTAKLLVTPPVYRTWGGDVPPESDLIEWAKQFGSPLKSFVDVGAHIGSWALELASVFEQVHAFEPQIESYNALCGGIALNALDGPVTAHKLAVSAVGGSALLKIISEDGGGSSIVDLPQNKKAAIEKVAVTALDDMQHLGDVGLIKLDCEGSELHAIIGAQQLIKRCRPVLIFECWAEDWFRAQREMTIDAVKELGYRVQGIQSYPYMYVGTPTG